MSSPQTFYNCNQDPRRHLDNFLHTPPPPPSNISELGARLYKLHFLWCQGAYALIMPSKGFSKGAQLWMPNLRRRTNVAPVTNACLLIVLGAGSFSADFSVCLLINVHIQIGI